MISKTFETYEEADIFIKEYERENGLSFIHSKIAKGFSESLSSTLFDDKGTFISKRLNFPTDEVPFLHLRNGTAHRICNLGGRRYRSKIKNEVPESDMSTTMGKEKRKYTHSDMKEELPMCPARVIIHSITLFPQYEIDKDTPRRKKAIIGEQCRSEFSPDMKYQGMFIVQITDNHTAHRKEIKVRMDQRVYDYMQGLVRRGYYGCHDIHDQLLKFMPKVTGITDTTNKMIYPSKESIRKWSFPHVLAIRNLEREKGFVYEMSDAIERMRELEWETETQFICDDKEDFFPDVDVYEAAKGKAIFTAPDSDMRCKVDTDDVPYIVLDTRQYECSYGIEYRRKFLDKYTPGQRKHMSKEGMQMCSARCTYRLIALFPGYRLGDDLPKKANMRKQIMQCLRDDLMNRTAYYEKVIAFAFPTVEEHAGHPVREANGHLFLDETVKSEIVDLVGEGVKSVTEMRRHLKMLLKHNFDEENMPGPFNKRYRPSTQTIMNLMYDAGVEPEDIVQDSTEPVPYISKPALYKDITTRLEERKRRTNANAAVSILPENDPSIETLIDSLDVFQHIQTTTSKSPAGSATSPTKTLSSTIKSDPNQFSDLIFNKQSECQALLEELLQVTYGVEDLFKLRDLLHHLKKLVEAVRGGRLLCDVIPLRRKRPAPKDGQTQGDEVYTATPINIDKGLDRAESTDEPPTKLVITDNNDQVTEVEIPKGYNSDEIVIYQENDENGKEQIYLVDQNFDKEEKEETKETPLPVVDKVKAEEIRKKKEQRDEVRKAMIKVKCKKHFSTARIIQDLKLDGKKKTVIHTDLVSAMADRKHQELELQKYESVKSEHSMMDLKHRQEEKKRKMMVAIAIEKAVAAKSAGPSGQSQHTDNPAGDETTTDKLDQSSHQNMEAGETSSQSTILEQEVDSEPGGQNSTSCGDGSSPAAAGVDASTDVQMDVNDDHSYTDNPDNQDKSGPEVYVDYDEDDNDIVYVYPDDDMESSDEEEEEEKRVQKTPKSHKKTTSYKKKDNESAEARGNVSAKDFIDAHKKERTSPLSVFKKKPKASTPVVQSSSNLKPGDTITFQPGTVNPFMNNLNTTGMVAINNVIYANTPMGLIPCMPMIMGAQNQPMFVNSPVMNASNASKSGTASKTTPQNKTGGDQTPIKLVKGPRSVNSIVGQQTGKSSAAGLVKKVTTPVITYSKSGDKKTIGTVTMGGASTDSPSTSHTSMDTSDNEEPIDNEPKAKRKILIIKQPAGAKSTNSSSPAMAKKTGDGEESVQAKDSPGAVVVKKVGNIDMSNLNIPAGTILKKVANIATARSQGNKPPAKVIIKSGPQKNVENGINTPGTKTGQEKQSQKPTKTISPVKIVKASEIQTNSPKMTTRGLKLRFSSSGEKIE